MLLRFTIALWSGLAGTPISGGPHPAAPTANPPQEPATAGPLNTVYMRRASYTVASAQPLPRHRGAGGWASSANRARPVSLAGTPQRGLHLLAEVREDGQGLTLRIINASADTVLFEAQDSQLNLNLQARNPQGVWQDIEYVPRSWCGNSYHQVYLAPRQYWQVAAPLYRGKIQTVLRAKLVYQDPQRPKNDAVLYSNEVAASVNPGQFSNKEGHLPTTIMDPYDE